MPPRYRTDPPLQLRHRNAPLFLGHNNSLGGKKEFKRRRLSSGAVCAWAGTEKRKKTRAAIQVTNLIGLVKILACSYPTWRDVSLHTFLFSASSNADAQG